VWDVVPCRQLRGPDGEEARMRVLGLAGLAIALAILGYLIVGYLGEAGKAQDALRAVPGSQAGQPVDLSKRGLEQRLSPILDQQRQRIEETTKAAGQ
jgi:hypothetical protein